TPYELKLALSRHFEWDGNYVTDFEGYLAMAEPTQSEGLDDDRTDEDTPHFSLVTGTYKSSKYHVDYNKADYLQSRSFKGLGADGTQDSPEASDRDAKEGATVTEGKSGIARGYKNERQYQS
ncbi:Diphthamide biosynthesis protein 2, partial [Spiromyces aspiralis]